MTSKVEFVDDAGSLAVLDMAGVAGREAVVDEGGAAPGSEAVAATPRLLLLLLTAAAAAVEGGWGLRKEEVSVRKEDPRRRLSGVCGSDLGMKLFSAFLTA